MVSAGQIRYVRYKDSHIIILRVYKEQNGYLVCEFKDLKDMTKQKVGHSYILAISDYVDG